MRKKHEALTSPTLFYCFVDFTMGKDCGPFTYVVPAAIVAQTLAECHQAWLDQPGKKGQKRKDGDMRRFVPDYSHLQSGKYYASCHELRIRWANRIVGSPEFRRAESSQESRQYGRKCDEKRDLRVRQHEPS